jgi:hypothetical protein
MIFADKKFQPTFDAEELKLKAVLKDTTDTESQLVAQIASLSANSRTKGAIALIIRLNEQLTAVRNLKLSAIKELRAIRRDIADRAIKIAEKEQGISGGTAEKISAAMLEKMQNVFLIGNSVVRMLEPVLQQNVEEEAEEEEQTLPESIEEGDIFSDVDGALWKLTAEGAESIGEVADLVYPDGFPDEDIPPYACLTDGTFVLVADIS